MRIDELLNIADSIRKNEISEELKICWINDVEGRVHCEILRFSPESYIKLSNSRQELSIPMPYARVYLSYMLAMMAFVMKDYELYTDVMMKYEQEFSEYAKYCLRSR